MKARLISLCLLPASLVGCSDESLEVQTVVGLRVLGARVEAPDEPLVAEPESGRGVHLRWLVVSDHTESYQAELQACLSTPVTTGLQHCGADPFVEQTASGDTGEDLSFDFELPRLEPGTEWVAKLAVCASGRPSFDGEGVGRCSDRSAVVEAITTARVGESDPNQNPDLSDDQLSLGGKAWTSDSELALGDSCDGDSGMPRLRAGRATPVAFELGGDDREQLPDELGQSYGGRPNESLLYAHFLSVKGLERPFSFIDSQSQEPTFEVDIELDTKGSFGSGTVAEFTLVARDDRGGTDWLRRKLCARSR